MSEKNELMAQKMEMGINMFSSVNSFELGQRMANVFAKSTLVPTQFQNNVGNCMIALNMSMRMQADPLMVMQSLCIIHGRPSFESKFLIACFNSCGRYSAIRYEMIGEEGKDNWGCRAWAIEKSSGDILKGTLVTIKMAKSEGWYDKSGSKWKTMPELMLQYRSAAFLIRTIAPEITLGFQTREEVEDSTGRVIDVEAVEVTNEEQVEKEVDENANKETLSIKNEPEPAEESNLPKDSAEKNEDAPEVKPMGKSATPSFFDN